MQYLHILLIFTQLFSSLTPIKASKSSESLSKKSDTLVDSSPSPSQHENVVAEETSSLDDPDDCSEDCKCLPCNNTLLNPKKIINPYREELRNRVAPKPFGSFCVKCAACLAVATEIQRVIESASQECETDLEKKKILLQSIEDKISGLCENGFKNFDLRLYANHTVVTNNFECTTHVVSSMDGSWTNKLREICALYKSRVNLEAVSLHVLDSVGNLTDSFCRSTGIFRDCANIKTHENITLPACRDCPVVSTE